MNLYLKSKGAYKPDIWVTSIRFEYSYSLIHMVSICYPEVVKESFIISSLNLTVKEPISGTETLIYINFSSAFFLTNINSFWIIISFWNDFDFHHCCYRILSNLYFLAFSHFLKQVPHPFCWQIQVFVVLSSLWQATIMHLLIDIPIFSNIFMTVSSKFFIVTFSGMPWISITPI